MLKKLNEIASNNDIKATAKSINQTQRNILTEEITKALVSMLGQERVIADNVYALSDYVSMGQTANNTIEFAIDNEKIGIIPVKLVVSLPNFDIDLDLFSRVESYYKLKEEKERIKAEKDRVKLERIKADMERRKAKAERETE